MIEQMMGFVIAFLILMFAWLFIKVAIAAHVSEAATSFDVLAVDTPGSAACNYALLNFLRSTGNKSLSPAEMLQISVADFSKYTWDWFEMNYTRGNPRMRGWQIEVSKKDAPLIVAGKEKFVASDGFDCTQFVPSANEAENYAVKLWLEY